MSGTSKQLTQLHTDIEQLTAQVLQSARQDDALAAAFTAAETAMKVLKLTDDKDEKVQASARLRQLIDLAEHIKQGSDWRSEACLLRTSISSTRVVASTPKASKSKQLREPQNSRSLSNAEKIIVLRGGFLNGVKFPEWAGAPTADECRLKDGEDMFLDESSELPLSDLQLDVFDDWRRPQDALPPPSWFPNDNPRTGPVMVAVREVDLVQDAATDCSVVASLCAVVARFNRGFPRIMTDALFPCDPITKAPSLSPNGKYVFRMNFNGCYRKVVIDDRIPASLSSRVIHVVDRNNPGLLWPALVEKAYLKVRGGYDFPGSNSGTDLWVLTGWVPEQVFLQRDDLEPDRFWKRMYDGFSYGDALVTLGTGKMSSKAESALGLAGEHDYAVLDVREVDGQRLMLVKNPWCQGTSWRGRYASAKNTANTTGADSVDHGSHDDSEPVVSPRDLLNVDAQLTPGTFWMDLSNVLQHFESIYLNWNPGLFSHRQDIHFTWDLSESSESRTGQPRGAYASLQNTPQFSVTPETGGTVWMLLWRHFQNVVPENATLEDIESGRQHIDLSGHISMAAFVANGRRVMLPEGHIEKACFVDSPQTLLKLENCEAQKAYTVAPLEQGLSPTRQAFTISAFSNSRMSFVHAAPRFQHSQRLSGAWLKETAGGNAQHPTYFDNPQFCIRVLNKGRLSILLESHSSELNVHVKLLYSKGKRVYRIRNKDIVVDSKDYRTSCCLARCDDLEAGYYTIICSTFEPHQMGDFTLLVESSSPTQTTLLPREGAGLMRTELAPAIFPHGQSKIAAPIVPQRLVNVYALARAMSRPALPNAARSHIRLSIEVDRGFEWKSLATSDGGVHTDSTTGSVRTEAIDIGMPDLARYGVQECWLLLERICAGAEGAEEQFKAELFADQPNAFKFGEWIVLSE